MQLGLGLDDFVQVDRDVQRRQITAENPDGTKGAVGRDVDPAEENWAGYGTLGHTRKDRPCAPVPSGETLTVAEIDGPGVIQHLFLAVLDSDDGGEHVWRDLVLRMYWDGEDEPSVEAPLGDFFCNGFGLPCHFVSIPMAVVSDQSMNCYFPMPFREHARIEVESEHPEATYAPRLFYEVDYSLVPEIPQDTGYFHAQWRRENPTTPKQDYTVLDGVEGAGQYLGTYFAWTALEPYWWGEGEVKFYLDGDDEYPTLCATGTETYPGGGWGFRAGTYEGPFFGYPLDESGDTTRLRDQFTRHGFYRWHIPDPIRFTEDVRVTAQQMGHAGSLDGGPFERCDDVASTAYWYQLEPHAPFPEFPDREARVPVHETFPDLPDQQERLP